MPFRLLNLRPHPIGCWTQHLIGPVVSDSVAIDATVADHISATRFASLPTMSLLVCFLASLKSHEEAFAGNHRHVKLNLRWVLTLRELADWLKLIFTD